MKRILLPVLALLSALSSPAATPVRKVSGEALGAVRYEARYIWGAINTKVADATITLERDNREGSDVLHSRATISATPFFRLFMNADYLADAYLSPATLEPVYYVNPFKKGGKDGKVEYTHPVTARLSDPPAPIHLAWQKLSLSGIPAASRSFWLSIWKRTIRRNTSISGSTLFSLLSDGQNPAA